MGPNGPISSLKIVPIIMKKTKVLSRDEINKRIALEKLKYGDISKANYMIQAKFLSKEKAIYSLSRSSHVSIRMELAKKGLAHDVLIMDESSSVRGQVASMGYGYDVLKKDKNRKVRREANIAYDRYRKQTGLWV